MRNSRLLISLIAGASVFATAPAFAQACTQQITMNEVLAAQKAWGDALVRISTLNDTVSLAAARSEAEKVIDAAYGYQLAPVLFKPTLTTNPQTFRTTRAGALAYFVGGNSTFPDDTGFALKHWRKVNIKNASVLFSSCKVATTMGKVSITDRDGNVTEVDKTWQFLKDNRNRLRIMVHHSSLPYVKN